MTPFITIHRDSQTGHPDATPAFLKARQCTSIPFVRSLPFPPRFSRFLLLPKKMFLPKKLFLRSGNPNPMQPEVMAG